jgi:uncharacterized protein (DUF1015 family)
MDGRAQTGIVAGASVSEYDSDKIKKHELTRKAKEDDRTRHIDITSAQTGPVFLVYRKNQNLSDITNEVTSKKPDCDFTAEDGVRHVLWVVSDQVLIDRIREAFTSVDVMYVADGHHRSASASRVQSFAWKEIRIIPATRTITSF